MEEAKLPVVSKSLDEEQETHKILLRSPCEIVESPVGSGGVIDLLSTKKNLGNFSKWGIEYVEVMFILRFFVNLLKKTML